MIVWSGKGILALLFFGLGYFIGMLIPDFGYQGEVISIFTSLGGWLTWYLGNKWNKAVIYYDEASQQYYKAENGDTIFWIPIQYIGVIGMIITVSYLVSINILVGIIWAVILIYITGYNYFKERGWAFSKSDKRVMSRNESTDNDTHKPSSGGWESRQDR
ncbi:hypothetical protein [Myroides sp. N17-2]|uniref:hypothetical protein n=1 Tax=Myroides sp. N17-2 TaxID=2030799 RepID=UPI000EFCA438|nr:hypothetical protein [Myroides sp. N17-2]